MLRSPFVFRSLLREDEQSDGSVFNLVGTAPPDFFGGTETGTRCATSPIKRYAKIPCKLERLQGRKRCQLPIKGDKSAKGWV